MTLTRPTALRVELPLDSIVELCRKWRIVKLEVFGSALRDDFSANSDLGFLYTFAQGSQVGLDLVTVHEEFKQLVGRPVDLVSRKAVEQSRNKYRRKMILDESRVVYAQ